MEENVDKMVHPYFCQIIIGIFEANKVPVNSV